MVMNNHQNTLQLNQSCKWSVSSSVKAIGIIGILAQTTDLKVIISTSNLLFPPSLFSHPPLLTLFLSFPLRSALMDRVLETKIHQLKYTFKMC